MFLNDGMTIVMLLKNNKPTQIIHHAMIKCGLDNFVFEVIASCRSQDNANYIETELVKQYDSFVKNGKGYNVTLGGMNAPKSNEWEQKCLLSRAVRLIENIPKKHLKNE